MYCLVDSIQKDWFQQLDHQGMYGGLAVQETVLNHFLISTFGKTFTVVRWSINKIVFLCCIVQQDIYRPETLGSNIFDLNRQVLKLLTVKFTKFGTALDVGFRQDSDSEFSLNRFVVLVKLRPYDLIYHNTLRGLLYNYLNKQTI